jgi:16S rRNA processing protein RimM
LKPTEPIIVGSIGAPHGIRGWVRINSFTEPSDNLFNYKLLMQSSHDTWQHIEIEQVKPNGEIFIAKLKDVTDRDQAALITNAKLAVERDQLPDLDADQNYWADVLGLKVVNEIGIQLGIIVDIFETGANDVLVVKDEINNKEHLIPYVPEMFVLEVDLPAGTMLVRWDAEF